MNPDPHEKISQHARSFIQKFLPEGVPDSHSLLYDWDSTSPFTPTHEQLSACIVDYTALLHLIDSTDALAIMGELMMSASELALAYLGRGQATSPKIPPDIVLALRTVSERLITQVEALMGGYFQHVDGVKRVRAIVGVLDAINQNPG